ncbi:MAG: MEDS domain-containing protein [Candidatus Omnitrophica bacterium]|nr:MEDS domain-containing protein [Candidatus Omnitrophota bacterium]
MEKNNKVQYESFTKLSWGTHLCSIYRDKQEQLNVAAPYLAFGLKHGQRCVYIPGETGKEDVCRSLTDYGITAEEYINKGQLIFLSQEQTYLKDDFFSPIAMLGLCQDAHYEALKSGYSGLRGCGELNWVSENLPGANRIIYYERELNFLFLHNRFIAMCQYNENKVGEDILLGVIYTHPKVIIYGKSYDNPFYVPPDILQKQEKKTSPPGEYYRLRDKIIGGEA